MKRDQLQSKKGLNARFLVEDFSCRPPASEEHGSGRAEEGTGGESS